MIEYSAVATRLTRLSRRRPTSWRVSALRREFIPGATRALVALLLLLPLLAACGTQESNLPKSADGLTKISVVLDWYPWANHTGLYYAQSKGYFKAEGLDVTIRPPGDSADIIKLVAAGTDHFGISYQTEVISARAAAVPVKSVAALVQHPLNTIMTLKSANITRPKQLEGKKVGMSGVPSDEPLLRTMMEADGGDYNKIEKVTVGFELMPALLGNKVDAVIGAYAVHESIVAEQQGKPVNVMNIQDWGVPDYYELILVTNDSMLKQNPEVVRKFLRAVVRGYTEVPQNKAAALDALKAAYPEADLNVERPGLDLIIPYWTANNVAFGIQTTDRWQSYATWMRQKGLLDKEVKVSDCFTVDFLPK
jgi:putative hydroxymethylpyrimidine transport system substrate-binding protein